MNNVDCLKKDNCCGCSACENICPRSAIKMIEDEEGFLIPKIDSKKCINCGLCLQHCPQFNTIKRKDESNIRVIAARNKNEDDKLDSSSGGLFSAIAMQCLDDGGEVYGCTFNYKMEPIQIGVNNRRDIKKLQGSKYVQSNVGNTYKEVKEKLENNKKILYVGTPCQIAGLKSYLIKDYDKLYTIDLVCHGVPSPKLFKKYIEWLEGKYKDKIINYKFREKKKNGWGLTAKIDFKNRKSVYVDFRLDPYYKSFIESKTYRTCCYECKYSNTKRVGDITLADFWGIEKEHPNFYDINGNSAVLINNDKGKKMIESIENRITYINTSIDKVVKHNKNLIESSQKPEDRKNVYVGLDSYKFNQFIKKNLKFKKDIRIWIITRIPKKIRNIMKSFANNRKK